MCKSEKGIDEEVVLTGVEMMERCFTTMYLCWCWLPKLRLSSMVHPPFDEEIATLCAGIVCCFSCYSCPLSSSSIRAIAAIHFTAVSFMVGMVTYGQDWPPTRAPPPPRPTHKKKYSHLSGIFPSFRCYRIGEGAHSVQLVLLCF